MNIKILGTGCPNCQKLEATAKKALEELGIAASVEKITDIQKIMEYNVMSMPVLVVNEKILSYGTVPSIEEIKKLITKDDTMHSDESSCGCSCGGNC